MEETLEEMIELVLLICFDLCLNLTEHQKIFLIDLTYKISILNHLNELTIGLRFNSC